MAPDIAEIILDKVNQIDTKMERLHGRISDVRNGYQAQAAKCGERFARIEVGRTANDRAGAKNRPFMYSTAAVILATAGAISLVIAAISSPEKIIETLLLFVD